MAVSNFSSNVVTLLTSFLRMAISVSISTKNYPLRLGFFPRLFFVSEMITSGCTEERGIWFLTDINITRRATKIITVM